MRNSENKEKTSIRLSPANQQAWKHEVRRRLMEIESGAVKAIKGEKISQRIGQIVGR